MKIHEAVDALTFIDEIDPDMLVSGAVVLVHLVNTTDGEESVFIATSDGLGEFTAGGLVHAAEMIVNNGYEGDE